MFFYQPVQDGGSSDLSAQSYLPSQYSSSRIHFPADSHANSDIRQHNVSPTMQLINITVIANPLVVMIKMKLTC